jgi:hypothetical protein
MTTLDRPATEPPPLASRPERSPRLSVVVVVGFVAAGIAARLWPRPALWLDEAQSVAIASLPLADIPGALREDGAPPLYYVVLHLWMRLFGDGDAAVRSLSVTASLAALALTVVIVGRWSGRNAALAVAVVMATNPFTIRYAAETRMYALVMLEVVIGVAAVDACVRRPRPWRVASVAAITVALLLTHYWAMYLVVAAVLALGVCAIGRPGARRTLLGVGLGVVLWAPWVPTLLFQSDRTATPWAQRASPLSLGAVFDVGMRDVGPLPTLLGVVTTVCVVVALRAGPLVGRFTTARGLGAVVIGTLVIALVGARTSGSAFAPRYTSVIVPLVIILTATGMRAMPLRWCRVAMVAAGVLGLTLAAAEIRTERTRSAAFVDPLRREASADDVLVYCPDQLGPAAQRLFRRAGVDIVRSVVFPPGRTPDRVDWIDYAARHAAAQPVTFAAALDRAAATSTIWLIWSGTYPPTQAACLGLTEALLDRRPAGCEVVADDRSLADHGALWRFEVGSPPSGASREDGSCPS